MQFYQSAWATSAAHPENLPGNISIGRKRTNRFLGSEKAAIFQTTSA
jgi:hypothetical protein